MTARFNKPNGIISTLSGDTPYIADADNFAIRMITGINVALSVDEEMDVPAVRLGLDQNVPNPFNPITTIRFTLPSAGSAALIVHDVTGREVINLMTGPAAAGENSVTWNGRDNRGLEVGSGVYFYTLQAGGTEETRRMVLVR